MLATLLFAALLPTGTPPVPEPTPVLVSIIDWRLVTPPRPSLPQQLATRSVQLAGGWTSGLVVGVAGGFIAIAPAFAAWSADSGDVGSGVLLVGAGWGYCAGAAWAISSAGDEIGGCSGSRMMTGLGTGAGLALTLAAFGTNLVEPTVESVLVGSLVPPLAGILVYEATRSGPCVRKPVPEGVLVAGGLLTASAGLIALRYALLQPIEPRRALVPLVQIRW